MQTELAPAKVRLSDELGQLPEPDFLLDGGRLRCYYAGTVKTILSAERERIIVALLAMHEENKMHHNYYGCLARLMQDGRL